MKKLFSEKIYDICPIENGFVFVYRRPEVENMIAVSYRAVSLETGVVSQRSRADYEFIKYGQRTDGANYAIGNFITCNCVTLDNGNLFIVSEKGDAKMVGTDGLIHWEGAIRYKDCGPTAIAHFGHTLWASFAEKNALIRFNLRTMREELRIGGSIDSSFSYPEGIWINDHSGKLIICNSKARNLLEVDVKTYTVEEKAVFDEPVHKYLCIDGRELVILDSGLYLL